MMHSYGEITQRRLQSGLCALQNEGDEEERETPGKSSRHRSVIKHSFSLPSKYQTRIAASHPLCFSAICGSNLCLHVGEDLSCLKAFTLPALLRLPFPQSR